MESVISTRHHLGDIRIEACVFIRSSLSPAFHRFMLPEGFVISSPEIVLDVGKASNVQNLLLVQPAK